MKLFYILLVVLFFSSCDGDETTNTYLPNTPVNAYIDMNLPSYSPLLIQGNSIETLRSAGGIEGFIILNTGVQYLVFDRACPHIPLQDCSRMNINYPFMVCSCDEEKFSVIDGSSVDGSVPQAARNYHVTQSGNVLHITN